LNDALALPPARGLHLPNPSSPLHLTGKTGAFRRVKHACAQDSCRNSRKGAAQASISFRETSDFYGSERLLLPTPQKEALGDRSCQLSAFHQIAESWQSRGLNGDFNSDTARGRSRSRSSGSSRTGRRQSNLDQRRRRPRRSRRSPPGCRYSSDARSGMRSGDGCSGERRHAERPSSRLVRIPPKPGLAPAR
jgi:hypothetical protein